MKIVRLDEVKEGEKFYWPNKVGIGFECYVAGPSYEMSNDIYVPWDSCIALDYDFNALHPSAMGKLEVLVGELE